MSFIIQLEKGKAKQRDDLSEVQVYECSGAVQVIGIPSENRLEYLAKSKEGQFFLLQRPRANTNVAYLRLHVGKSGEMKEANLTGSQCCSLTSQGWTAIDYYLDKRYSLSLGNNDLWDGKERHNLKRLFYAFEGFDKSDFERQPDSSG